MLGIPALLIFASGLAFFINGYVDSVVRAVAVDASRYAALADQTIDGANQHLDAKLSQLLPTLPITKNIEISSTAKVEVSYLALPSIFNLLNRSVTVRVESPIETY